MTIAVLVFFVELRYTFLVCSSSEFASFYCKGIYMRTQKIKKQATLRKSYKRVYEKCVVKATGMVLDKKKISQKIRKARKIFERLHNIPRCETLSKHICDFCDLLSDYLDGIYTNLPLSTIVSLIAGILYLVLPFDVLADFVPVFGWIDDAAVLSFIVATEQNDINEYLKWKETKFLNDKNGELSVEEQ